MRYVIALVILPATLSSARWAETPGWHCVVVPWGGGGPDSFGYRYLDSDTTCPGSPVFNWVDVKGIGTRVTGLGDDNYAGPFGIGFEFPYYGYRVDTVYIGADGYITFTHASLPGLPPNPIPDTSEPNNTAAPLLSDLDCGAGGSVWYWTSPDQDTFIVQYDSIRFWRTGGNNTFQIVLSRLDSTITIQYKEQSGEPDGGWAPERNQTGIEDSSGAIGLNYLSGTSPSQNMIHDSLAVLFIPPDSAAPGTNEVLSAERGTMNAGPTIVRGVMILVPGLGTRSELPERNSVMSRAMLLDASGRKVLDLHPGANDVQALAPGVYFVREEQAQAQAQAQAVRKIVIAK